MNLQPTFKPFSKREVRGKMSTDDEFGEGYINIYCVSFFNSFLV